jgi:hypothetical protein
MSSNPTRFQLTGPGMARRREILERAQSALRWRRRRRSALLAGSIVLIPAGAALTALAAHRLSAPALRGAPGTTAVSALTLRLVRDDPSILARVSVPTRPLEGSVLIGDRELRGLLREAGCDEGTIRIEGRFLLASDLAADRPDAGSRPAGPG